MLDGHACCGAAGPPGRLPGVAASLHTLLAPVLRCVALCIHAVLQVCLVRGLLGAMRLLPYSPGSCEQLGDTQRHRHVQGHMHVTLPCC